IVLFVLVFPLLPLLGVLVFVLVGGWRVVLVGILGDLVLVTVVLGDLLLVERLLGNLVLPELLGDLRLLGEPRVERLAQLVGEALFAEVVVEFVLGLLVLGRRLLGGLRGSLGARGGRPRDLDTIERVDRGEARLGHLRIDQLVI